MNPDIVSLGIVPTRGVRLDDRTVSFTAKLYDHKDLNKNWTAKFDQNGMVQGLRVPLGHASKQFKKQGETAVYGHVLENAREGFCYDWLIQWTASAMW